jgi:SAM-dependent methyltransferase
MSDGEPLDLHAAPALVFSAQNAEAYERAVGQWSRHLAPLLIRFGGLTDGDRVLDVGCGTGSLAFALPEIGNVAQVTGIDQAVIYVDYASARNADPRISFQQADARALPFADDMFDRAFSMLVLQFIPDSGRAVAEMRRVVKPGGTVTAAVWDAYGGLPNITMIMRTATVLDPTFMWPSLRALNVSDGLANAWHEHGLIDVRQTSLLIRMEFSCFEDYWASITGEGPAAQFVGGLSDSFRAKLIEHVRRAYCANQSDGPRSFPCVAWACRGTVPA